MLLNINYRTVGASGVPERVEFFKWQGVIAKVVNYFLDFQFLLRFIDVVARDKVSKYFQWRCKLISIGKGGGFQRLMRLENN